MEEKGKRKRRSFTPEYKAEAVRLVETSGRTCAEIARDLGIQPTGLRAWVEQARIDAGKGRQPDALTSDEKKELAALRKENRTLREEREILKKAAAFFAKENR
jgi:transposase